MRFTSDVSSFTSVTTLDFQYVVDCQILINGEPLQNIDETSVMIEFSGLDLKFLGSLLKPDDIFHVYITIDNILPVTTVKTQLAIFRNDKYMFDVTLPMQMPYNLDDVIHYSFKA